MKQEVDRQHMVKQLAGWKQGEVVEGRIKELEVVYGRRVMVIEDPHSKRYAVIVDAHEREARAKLNEQGKPEVVREQPAKPLERGDIVRCDLTTRSVTSRELEANTERMSMEREIRRQLDKDRGWER